MTQDHLAAILETASAATDSEGWSKLPEGRGLTLYVAHEGVQLTVSRVEAVRTSGHLLRARSVKGEIYIFALEDLFAASTEAPPSQTRKAGFV